MIYLEKNVLTFFNVNIKLNNSSAVTLVWSWILWRDDVLICNDTCAIIFFSAQDYWIFDPSNFRYVKLAPFGKKGRQIME